MGAYRKLELLELLKGITFKLSVLSSLTFFTVFAYKLVSNSNRIEKSFQALLTRGVVFRFERAKGITLRIPKGTLIKAVLYPDYLALFIHNVEIDIGGKWRLKVWQTLVKLKEDREKKTIEGKKAN